MSSGKVIGGSVTIVTPDTVGMKLTQNAMVARATDILVQGEETHREAQELLRKIATVRNDVVELFRDSKASANKTHKDICAAEKKLLSPCDDAREIVTGKIINFEAEVRKKTEQAQALMQNAQHMQEERARLAEVAPDLADALPPVEVPDVHVPGVAEVEGVSSRTSWKPEVIDLIALLQYIVLHPEWSNLVEPNMVALRQLVNAQKANFNLPGVRAVEVPIMAVRRV